MTTRGSILLVQNACSNYSKFNHRLNHSSSNAFRSLHGFSIQVFFFWGHAVQFFRCCCARECRSPKSYRQIHSVRILNLNHFARQCTLSPHHHPSTWLQKVKPETETPTVLNLFRLLAPSDLIGGAGLGPLLRNTLASKCSMPRKSHVSIFSLSDIPLRLQSSSAVVRSTT